MIFQLIWITFYDKAFDLFSDSVPSKNLPNQGGKQANNDYIYYDRDATDESTSLLLETSEGTDELSQE